jgi:bifunctional UDP-N-acetylglucosamine pyrophosphorylase/glucosamine-1-phosphate N-acetyltransferase
MKAVILVAGKSTRTYPLTLTKPKPLLKIANKPLIIHNLEQIESFVDEVIIIVGYKSYMISSFLKNQFNKLTLTYIEQKAQLGTAHALMQAEKYLKGKFIVMMGDDLYFKEDIKKLLKYELAVMAKKVKAPENFGVFKTKNNKIIDIIEKPKEFVSDLANTGCYLLNKEIFPIIENLRKSERGEYELTDALSQLAKGRELFCVASKLWFPIAYPWNLLEADQLIRKNKLLIGNSSIVSDKVANSSIGINCIIKGAVKNSIIGDNVRIEENSIVENSVFGDNIFFSGKILSKNKVKVNVNGKLV